MSLRRALVHAHTDLALRSSRRTCSTADSAVLCCAATHFDLLRGVFSRTWCTVLPSLYRYWQTHCMVLTVLCCMFSRHLP